MENSKKLIDWALSRHQLLDLKVTKLTWVDEWIPGHFDFNTQISVGSEVFKGRGFSNNIEIAMVKSIAEALERAVCKYNGIHSSGVAAHTDKIQAQINAKTELIERDLFLSHYITHTPLEKINWPSKERIDGESIKEKLEKHDIDLSFYSTKKYNGLGSIIAITSKSKGLKKFGSIIGLGCSNKPEVAIEKALIECLSNTINFIHNENSSNLSLEQFLSLEKHGPRDHHNLFLNPGNSEILKSVLCNEVVTKIEEKNTNLLDQVDIELLSQPKELADCPLYFFRAYSTDLQNMFYGKTTEEKINRNRMKTFLGELGSEIKINFFPHPIG